MNRTPHSMPSGQAPRVSIIIPAYNEARVIARCLERLLEGLRPGTHDIIVVCNGCHDDTADVARRFEPAVRVVEIERASKTAAINLGDNLARTFPRVYLDSDLAISGAAVDALVRGLDGDVAATRGYMDLALAQRSWPITAFYRVWTRHPDLRHGKFGGIYALSEAGWQRRGPLPDVIADDTFVANRFHPGECSAVDECRFTMYPPTSLVGLVKIRTRSYLGNLQLARLGHSPVAPRREAVNGWMQPLSRNVKWWPALATYLMVNSVAKVRARFLNASASYTWLRDESSRRFG